MDFAAFPTRLGWMAVAGSAAGIVGVALPRRELGIALDALCLKIHEPPASMREVDSRAFGTLPDRLAAYLCGEKVDLSDQLDRSRWTEFRSRVWDATCRIPYGQTRSYSWVAAAAGQPAAYRATGQALHHNPVPLLVPCHRVIGQGGQLTGFGSGLELKQRLLELESGAPVISNDAVG
jgi:methylated-DNA-[protein]-cysteine S-methyltransferase